MTVTKSNPKDLARFFQFKTLDVPSNSPLRRVDPLFWGVRANDEGVKNPDGFHALVNAGKIQLIAPARADRYGDDGHSIVLKDGRSVGANAVILATGFRSSWDTILDGKNISPIVHGIRRRADIIGRAQRARWQS